MGQVVLATPSSSIRLYASVFESRVLNRLPETLRARWEIWHVGVGDADALASAPSPSPDAILFAHDPEKIIGLSGWRSPALSLGYASWRAKAELNRWRLLKDFLRKFAAITVTSQYAADTAGKFDFASYLGPVGPNSSGILNERSQPTFGVMGHLHPARHVQDLFSMAVGLPRYRWEVVGRNGPIEYLDSLRLQAPENVDIVGELESPQLWEKVRRWTALVVLPYRARSLGASLAVVDCMTLGVPVLYPCNAHVIAEYVGKGGACYERDRLPVTVRALEGEWQRLSREAARRARDEFAWDVVSTRWTKYLLGLVS